MILLCFYKVSQLHKRSMKRLTALVTLDATKQMGQRKEDRGINSASLCPHPVRTSDWSYFVVQARVDPTPHHAPGRLQIIAPSGPLFLTWTRLRLPRVLRRSVLGFLLQHRHLDRADHAWGDEVRPVRRTDWTGSRGARICSSVLHSPSLCGACAAFM